MFSASVKKSARCAGERPVGHELHAFGGGDARFGIEFEVAVRLGATAYSQAMSSGDAFAAADHEHHLHARQRLVGIGYSERLQLADRLHSDPQCSSHAQGRM
jgi:hypothetical protein